MGDRKPHILWIVVHDLGTCLGAYGEGAVRSPVLDELASQGVVFLNHFATAPFCSPSRGSYITGKYPHVSGLMGLVNLGWDLPGENVTLAQSLGSAGYETFLFGLQHEAANRNQLGFDYSAGSVGACFCEEVAEEVIAERKKMATAGSM